MAQLRQDYPDFARRNCVIAVVGPEDASAFREYWSREQLPFIGLPDPDHTVLDLYGQEVSVFKLGRMPAQVLIDRSGVLRLVHHGHSMADIPASDEIFVLLDSWESPSAPGD